MNTTTEPTTASAVLPNQAVSSEIASSVASPVALPVDPIAQTKAKLDLLRAELQAAEADLAAKQRAADEEKAAMENTRRAELAELPSRYGFKDMRSLVGFLGYHFLHGTPPPKKARHAVRRSTKLSDLQRQHLLDDMRAIPETHKTIPQIAAKYGVSRQLLYAYAAQFKIALPSEVQSAA